MQRFALLYTHDRNVDELLAQALFGTGTIILNARSVGDALQIVCHWGRELDFVVLDFNEGCRGMILLSALHTCFDKLPTFVVTSKDSVLSSAVAYANGA
jgi:DNA-binding NtrC family response regulator